MTLRKRTRSTVSAQPVSSGGSIPTPRRRSVLRAGRSKYGARRTEAQGIVFHSRKEATRYLELCCLVKAGQIDGLTLQPRYALTVGAVTIGHYVADFAYVERGDVVVEDVKGYDVPLGKWKRKHCEAQYGIAIRIIT